MTSVFVTQTGGRYHARTDLECMEKARSFQPVDLATAADGGLQPCITCDAPTLPGVTEGDSQWLRRIDDWQRAGEFDSIWEQVFARRVLARTASITVDDVEVQTYIKAGGDTYKVDFFIPKARLVLEVDGYTKDDTPPSPTDAEKRNRRDAALQSQDMQVLHFTNAQVQREPIICRQQVSAALDSRVAAPPQAATPSPVAVENSKSSRTPLYIGLALAALVVAGLLFVAIQAGLGSTDSPNPIEAPTAPPSSEPAAIRYANCADAQAAGVTPIERGTPLYEANRHLDRDGDGIACE